MLDLERALTAARRSGRSTAVLLVDLDHFKQVNDGLGHDAGDTVVTSAARRIAETVRGDDIVGRLGGDEFLIVVRDVVDPMQPARMAWRLVEAFREPFEVAGRDIYATASVGVAIGVRESTAADLVREADTAMYLAKTEGRDRVCLFNGVLAERVSHRLRIETDLRPALRKGELEVWYQPQVKLADGRLCAAEALLRWRRDDGIVWPAGRFIDVAEDSGLIVDIGTWVLRTACRDAARWNRVNAELAVAVSVNVSARQLLERDFIRVLDEALHDSGLAPALLCIEVTETALLTESAIVRSNLRDAAIRGLPIALDDFGTGYASLSYLREHPFDVIKLDRSFVAATPRDSVSTGLVRGVLRMADAAGLTVIAEGVETTEQRDFLLSVGCTLGQGYLFAKALPVDELLPMVTRGRPDVSTH